MKRLLAAALSLALAAPAGAATIEPIKPVETAGAPLAAPQLPLSALPLPAAELNAAIQSAPTAPEASTVMQAAALSTEAATAAQKPQASVEAAREQGAGIFEGARASVQASADAVAGADVSEPQALVLAALQAPGNNFRKPPLPELPPEKKPFFIRHYPLARAVAWPFMKLVYRVKAAGLENIPSGPVMFVPNHVSYVDGLVLSLAANRPMRFMLKRSIYDKLPGFFYALGAIPVEAGDDAAKTTESLARARAALKNGESLVIFPEGRLSRTGNMAAFKTGFTRIVDGLDVPVVPAHLDNLAGSFFSGAANRSDFWEAMKAMPRRVGVTFGPKIGELSAQAARDEVEELSAKGLEARVREQQETLPRAFLRNAKRLWGKTALADSSGKTLTYGKALAASVLLAAALSKTVGAAHRVGVLVPPSVGGALANVSLAALGRVPVNLNYTASREAIDHAVQVAGIETVVTSRKAIEVLKEKGAAIPDRR